MVQRLLCIRFGEILLDAKCMRPILLCTNCYKDFGVLEDFRDHLSECLHDEGLLLPNAELQFHGNKVQEYCNNDTQKNLVVYNVNSVTVTQKIADNDPLDMVKIEAELQDPKWFDARNSPVTTVTKVSTRQSVKRTASAAELTVEPPTKRSLVQRNSIATTKAPAPGGTLQRKSTRQRSSLGSAQQLNIKDPLEEHEFVIPHVPRVEQNVKKTDGGGGGGDHAKTLPRAIKVVKQKPLPAQQQQCRLTQPKIKTIQQQYAIQKPNQQQQKLQTLQIQKQKPVQQQQAVKNQQPVVKVQQQQQQKTLKVQQEQQKTVKLQQPHQTVKVQQQQPLKVLQQPAKEQQLTKVQPQQQPHTNPPKQQETENLLKKLHNLGLEVKRTQPSASLDPLLNAKNTHTVEILNKLKAKGMQVKVLKRNNNNNNIAVNSNGNSINTKESSREFNKNTAMTKSNFNQSVTIRKLPDTF